MEDTVFKVGMDVKFIGLSRTFFGKIVNINPNTNYPIVATFYTYTYNSMSDFFSVDTSYDFTKDGKSAIGSIQRLFPIDNNNFTNNSLNIFKIW